MLYHSIDYFRNASKAKLFESSLGARWPSTGRAHLYVAGRDQPDDDRAWCDAEVNAITHDFHAVTRAALKQLGLKAVMPRFGPKRR